MAKAYRLNGGEEIMAASAASGVWLSGLNNVSAGISNVAKAKISKKSSYRRKHLRWRKVMKRKCEENKTSA
jgi:hypothetical protein